MFPDYAISANFKGRFLPRITCVLRRAAKNSERKHLSPRAKARMPVNDHMRMKCHPVANFYIRAHCAIGPDRDISAKAGTVTDKGGRVNIYAHQEFPVSEMGNCL
jgi:hypothetical protein